MLTQGSYCNNLPLSSPHETWLPWHPCCGKERSRTGYDCKKKRKTANDVSSRVVYIARTRVFTDNYIHCTRIGTHYCTVQLQGIKGQKCTVPPFTSQYGLILTCVNPHRRAWFRSAWWMRSMSTTWIRPNWGGGEQGCSHLPILISTHCYYYLFWSQSIVIITAGNICSKGNLCCRSCRCIIHFLQPKTGTEH